MEEKAINFLISCTNAVSNNDCWVNTNIFFLFKKNINNHSIVTRYNWHFMLIILRKKRTKHYFFETFMKNKMRVCR